MEIDDTTENTLPAVTMRDPADVVCMVPRILGFYPCESIVLMAVQDNAVALSVRMPLGLTEQASYLQQYLELIRHRASNPSWILVGYGADQELVENAMQDVAIRLKGEIIFALQVGEGCFWELVSPSKIHPLSPDQSPAVAQAVVAGMSAEIARDALWNRISPPSEDAESKAKRLVEAAKKSRDLMGIAERSLRCDDLLDQAELDLECFGAEKLVELGILISQPLIRDIALRRLSKKAKWHNIDLWQRVLRNLPLKDQGPALPVLGIACWVAGEGVLQAMCSERGQLIAPNDHLVELLAEATDMALPPKFWFEVLAGLDELVMV